MRKPFVKLILPLLIIILSFTIVACTGANEEDEGGSDEIKDVVSISIDSSTIPTSAIAGQVDLSQIKLLVLTKSGEVVSISLTEDMIATFDKNKLNRVGTHHINVVYGGMTVKFILYIKEAPVVEHVITIHDGAPLGEELGENNIWSGSFPKGSRIAIRARDRDDEGYYFHSWRIEGQVYNENQSCYIDINRNIVIYAHYEIMTFQVLFDSQGGDYVRQMNTRIIEESPVTNKTECVFLGWMEKDTQTMVTFPYTVTKNTTLVAVWEELGLVFDKTPADNGYTVVDYVYTGSRTSLTIPEKHNDINVIAIDKDAFKNATTLQDLTLPRYLEKIDDYAFVNCVNLLNINAHPQSEYFTSINGVLYKDDTLVAYPAGRMGVNFDFNLLPSTITKIGTAAFYNANLGSIDISSHIQSIGDDAFNSRTIDNVVFHSAAPSFMGNNLFNDNINHIFVRNMQHMDGFLNLNDSVFVKEPSIYPQKVNVMKAKIKEYQTITIGAYQNTFMYRVITRDTGGVQAESLEIFAADRSLKQISIPTVNIISRQITSIGRYAFSYCYNLETLTVPHQSSVDRILQGAFDNTKWQIERNHNHIIDDMIIINGILFRALDNRSEYVIPHVVQKVAEESFQNMDKLTKVQFATDSNGQLRVTSIEANAFKDCINLNNIIIPHTVNRIGKSAFENTRLRSFYIQDTVERPSQLLRIEDFAFRNAVELTEISLGNFVNHIGLGVFNGCFSLERIMINQSPSTNSEYFVVKEGVLYQKNKDLVGEIDNFGQILHTYPAGRIADVYELPLVGMTGVTHILPYAFYYSNITAIKAPSTLAFIQENAIIVPQLVYIEFSSEIPVPTFSRLFPEYSAQYVIINEHDTADYSTFGFPEGVMVKSNEIDTSSLLGMIENGEGDKFVYRNDHRGVYIVAAERAKASLNVPHNVTIGEDTLDIIGLEGHAFRGNILKELILPYTIETINAYALYYCTDLRKLTSNSLIPPELSYLSEEEPEELISFHPDIFIENLLIFVPEEQRDTYADEWPTHIDFIIPIGQYPQVVFEPNGGDEPRVIDPTTGNEIDITQREDIPYLPRTERRGYMFEGWYENAEFEGEPVTFPYTKYRNIVLYAKWAVQEFEIVFLSHGGSEIPSMLVRYGESYVLPVPQRDGYNFLGWFDAADETLQYTDHEGIGLGVGEGEANGTWGLIQNEAFELVARWQEAEYIVTYDPNGGEILDGYGNPVTQKIVTYNNTFTLDVPQREGYEFRGWRDEYNTPITDNSGKSFDKWLFFENKTLYARWTALSYKVQFDDGFGGYYDQIEVTYGSDDFEFPVPFREDSVFFGWYDGVGGTGTQYTDQYGKGVRAWDKVSQNGDPITLYAQWPIDISTIADFELIRNNPEGSYILTNDIVINVDWTPIGIDADTPFTGILDGNGYSILNLTLNSQHNGYLGLIGYNKGIVRNLNLGIVFEDGQPDYSGKAEFNIYGNKEFYVGGIAGYNEGLIQNCQVAAIINVELNADNTNMYVGGVAGYNSGRIENTKATVEIEAEFAYDVISEGEKYIGSIAGYHALEGMIDGCYYNRIMASAGESFACGNEEEPETLGGYYNTTGTVSDAFFW